MTHLTPRKTPYNSGFALWGLTCSIEKFMQSSTFVLRMNSSTKNPSQNSFVVIQKHRISLLRETLLYLCHLIRTYCRQNLHLLHWKMNITLILVPLLLLIVTMFL